MSGETLRGLVIDPATRQASLAERPLPTPGAGEALIRVRMAGICGTDLELAQGYMDHAREGGILGHEFVGVVESAPDAPERVGRRVVGEINAGCGRCRLCAGGDPRHCPGRTVLGILGRDGALASHVTLPLGNLHDVPDDLGDELAVFTEPLAAALEILEQVHVRPTDEVLLLGDGRLGQLIGQVLLLTGARVTVCGRHEAKLAKLAARGARTVSPDDLWDDPGERPDGRAPKQRFDVVVEATGAADGPQLAVGLCRPRGTVVLKSTTHGSSGAPIVPTIVDEITLVGSRCGPFEPALRLLRRGRIDVASLVSGIYPLSKAREAFDYARSRDVLKVLIDATG